MITDAKLKILSDKITALGIKDSDIIEKFMTSGNKGGQKANKSSNAVYLKHLPTGIEVKCKETRHREINRFLAKRLLVDKIEELQTGRSTRTDRADKIRKAKNRKQRKAAAKKSKALID
ncbi:MAG: peptide chain release factor-like protein [Candidatus Goldiibacteriota bacterium HGW-Goldbacteria-1]|jgi:protein subunit release factor B|nr:MAG: peptide chain release factor-like protein [Candidatus Goldiibacteriota bacterium HGW-Goldbacteria-1]